MKCWEKRLKKLNTSVSRCIVDNKHFGLATGYGTAFNCFIQRIEALFKKKFNIIIDDDDRKNHPDCIATKYDFFMYPAKCKSANTHYLPAGRLVLLYYLCKMLKNTLIKAAVKAGAILKQYYGSQFQISNKEGVNNLVTEADHAAEKLIMQIIRDEYPDHYILSEESGDMPTASSYKWIIDPLDGTVNFAHGLPLCCVSIGLEQDGDMIMGAVFNPFFNEFYFAQKGYGATLNDQLIQVSQETKVGEACLVTGFPYTYLDMPNGPLEVFSRLIRKGVPVRRLGSAAMDLCWVAAGRFDGFYEHKLNAWDSAAGFLIVKEAGGRVSDFSGAPYSPYQPQIVATNGKIHEELLQWINGSQPDGSVQTNKK